MSNEFFSAPNAGQIIAYVLLAVCFIGIYLHDKKHSAKDNKVTKK